MNIFNLIKLFSFTLFLLLVNGNCGQSEETISITPQFSVSTLTNISNTPGSNQGANQMPQGITTDGENIYYTDFFNHAIFRVSIKTGKMDIFAGVIGVPGFNDGDARFAMFNRPYGITNYGGYLYVADSGNSVIRKISLATRQVTTFCGKPVVGGHLNGPAEKALLRFPIGVSTDGKFLFVADTGNSTIRKIDLNSRYVTTIAGMAGVAGLADGKGDKARFNVPKGIATDGKNVYVADTINGAIRKVVIATGEVSTLAGKDFQPGGADGVGSAARFNNPTGAVIMGDALFIADSGNNNIRKINPESGEVKTIAGKRGFDSNCPLLILYHKLSTKSEQEITSESADGIGILSRFKSPSGITTDGNKLFVIDTKNHLIRILEKK